MQANLSLFYDNNGALQIGKIVNRTSVNENTDADIFAAELELLYAPNENWQFNAAFSYLDTELGETATVDPRDPTQGRQDVTLLKDFSAGAEYTHYFDGGLSATARVDYYWQDEFYSATFNRAQDLIDAWDVWNAQVTVYGKDQQWYAKLFLQNIENDDEIGGTYATDPSPGLFTNGFFMGSTWQMHQHSWVVPDESLVQSRS